MTPEQKAATERLEEAVKAALEAQGLGVGVLTEFVVVAAQARFEADGGSSTGVYYLTSGEGVPYYRMLGLLDFAKVALCGEVQQALSGDDE